jgi:hypothetical protein
MCLFHHHCNALVGSYKLQLISDTLKKKKKKGVILLNDLFFKSIFQKYTVFKTIKKNSFLLELVSFSKKYKILRY